MLAVPRVDAFTDGVRLVDNHLYGKVTAVFTRDGDAARCYQHAVQIGMVGIDVPILVPVPVANDSFGRWNASLFGDTARLRRRRRALFTRGKGG